MGSREHTASTVTDGGLVDKGRDWVLLDGDRLLLAAGIAIGVFALLLVSHWLDLIAFTNDDSITRLAGGMIAGTLSLVTLVVSINQLILSREFKAAGEIRKQLDNIMDFHTDIEDALGLTTTPADPTTLLRYLIRDIDDHASSLHVQLTERELTTGQDVDTFIHHLRRDTDRIESLLEGADFDTFTALSATIKFHDSRHLSCARRFRNQMTAELTGESFEAVDGLVDALLRYTIAREHFKTMYLLRELTRFSQLTIMYGVPSVVAAVLIGLLYADFAGATLDIAIMPYVISALIVIVIFPLAILASYILRTATIAHRTASVGPIVPETDQDAGVTPSRPPSERLTD